ncbi:flavodoxin [Arcobacter sp. LA11]|uniref:flavodoxin n=1 Tax=Arcobacter sp. LA11 TaxID=1898176 RepID=UPI0009347326|nr:flavodoxin [Arcobacter sp. LA11]
MKNIAIFYASSTGKTKFIANELSIHLEELKEYNIQVTGTEYMRDYSNIIFGISTWDGGSIQEDWKEIWDEFCEIDFSNKNVAIFGLGDQKKYPDKFVAAMKPLYDQLKSAGANVIGFTSTEDYNFKYSDAIEDGQFVGLVLDLENQSELTTSRIEDWVKSLKKDFI